MGPGPIFTFRPHFQLQKMGKARNGAWPHFLFSPPDNKTAPVCAPDEIQASPSIFLAYMYKYFTFILNLSCIEDRVKSINSEINHALLLAYFLQED